MATQTGTQVTRPASAARRGALGQQEAPGSDHSHRRDGDLFAGVGGDPVPTGMDDLDLAEDQG